MGFKMFLLLLFIIGRMSAEESDHRVFHVECTRENLTATWETSVFLAKAPLNIAFLDSQCNAFYQNQTHTWITTKFIDCGTVILQKGDLIIQENVATATVFYGNAFITRKRSYVYNISCVFDRRLNVMTANSFLASDKILIGEGNDTSTFSAEIEMFQSSSYLEVLTDDPIPVYEFEPMYFGIKTDNENPGLKFVVDQCYAIPATGEQEVKFVFYDTKCPLDKTFKINDYSNKHFNFEIEAFNFIRVRNSIRIHCKLLVCQSNSTLQECQQECAVRKRRDVEEVPRIRIRRNSKRSVEEVESIDVETKYSIKYEKKETCKDIVCPSNSTCLELYPAVCWCNDGYVRETTTGQCRMEQSLNVHDIHIDLPYLPSYDDPKSIDYQRVVTKLNYELLTKLNLDEMIEGLKVTNIRKGSIIADVALIYSKKVSKEEAFASFLSSTMAYARNSTSSFSIKPDMVPTLGEVPTILADEGINDEKEIVKGLKEVSSLIIGVSVAVAVLFVAVAVAGAVLYRKYHPRVTIKEVEISQGAENYGIDMAEVPEQVKSN